MGYQLIETIEVGAGGAASIEFTSIPQDGVDLLLVVSARSERNDGPTVSDLKLNFNSDTTASYDRVQLLGNGSSVFTFKTSSSETYLIGPRIPSAAATSNTFSNDALYISNYTSSTDKSISQDKVQEDNASAAWQGILAQKYANSSGISSILIADVGAYTIAQYSTASLYKITAD